MKSSMQGSSWSRRTAIRPFRHWVLAPAPWKYAAVFLLGLGLTAAIVVVELIQLQRAQEATATERAAAVGSSISRAIDTYAVPTLAGETFVASGVAEAEAGSNTATDHVTDGFEAFTGPLRRELGAALLDYQIAPVGVVTYSTYPQENAAALGHDILKDDDRREAAIDAIDERLSVVTGPIDLIQGGRGIVIRQPIFIEGLQDFETRYASFTGDATAHEWLGRVPDDFWGFSTVVIDFEELLNQAGIDRLNPSQVSLRPIDEAGRIQPPIWGSGTLDSRTARFFFDLPDDRQWLVTVTPERVEANLVWPVGLLGMLLSALASVLYGRYFRARNTDRLGYEYGSLVWGASRPEEVAQLTADFLVDTYPSISGVIAVHEPADFRIRFGHSPDTKCRRSLTRVIDRGGRSYAIIELQVPARYSRRDVAAVLDVLDRPLASSLVSIAHQEYLEMESSTDHLTSLRNRRLLQPTFEDLAAVAERQNASVSLAVLDIDHFKDLNDGKGHQFGDLVLQRLAASLNDAMRGMDTVFRFGGDEFVILALTSHAIDAPLVFDRVKEAANASLLEIAPEFRQCTCSIGVATSERGPFPPMTEMLSAADAALYKAKHRGRNRVEYTIVTDGSRLSHAYTD